MSTRARVPVGPRSTISDLALRCATCSVDTVSSRGAISTIAGARGWRWWPAYVRSRMNLGASASFANMPSLPNRHVEIVPTRTIVDARSPSCEARLRISQCLRSHSWPQPPSGMGSANMTVVKAGRAHDRHVPMNHPFSGLCGLSAAGTLWALRRNVEETGHVTRRALRSYEDQLLCNAP